MRLRGVAPAGVGMAVVIGLAATLSARSAADPGGRQIPLIDIRLTASQDLPAEVTAHLIAEAGAIWQQAGVRLRWPSASRDEAADAALRVLVMQRVGATIPSGHTWPVGELLTDQAGTSFAVVSTGAARRVVAAAGHTRDPQALLDRRLGVVLGRAVAHEVGHYLLATRGHARSGLMRAHVGVADFADLRRGGFHLDHDAGEWIRASLPRPAAHAALVRFSYSPPH
jgi:hypothetical protein